MHDYYRPDFEVKVRGLTLQSDVRDAVISLSVDNNVEQADMFQLVLNNAGKELADSPVFSVGNEVEVHMGYVGDLQPMMLGEIVAVEPSFPASGAPTLAISGYDKSHRMRHNSPARFTFKFFNDSAIVALIAAENLLIPVVDPALIPPKGSVQQTGSDWALLKELADRNGFELFVHWDKLYFRLPRPQTRKIVLEYGRNLSSFSPRLSTSGMAGIQVIRGYDYELAEKIVAILPAIALGSDLDSIVERLGKTFIDQLVKLGRNVIRDQPVDSFVDAAVVAKSLLKQLLQGLFEGSGTCIGLPSLRAGDYVEIAGVGKRFSGSYRLTKVAHTINNDGYQVQFDVSQKHPASFLKLLRKNVVDSAPTDKQAKINGVVIGKVENNIDPKLLGRVQLSFPSISDVNLSAWARVASPMAGSDRGMYFLPERGDEVLVVFDQGDINKPIVIGCLWNGKARPPEINKGINAKKVIRTKSKMEIAFDETPGKETLTVKDKVGSSVTFDSLKGDIIIEAKGNVVIKSGPAGKIDLNP